MTAHGTLTNYQTGETIRPATAAELAASVAADSSPTWPGMFKAEIGGSVVAVFVDTMTRK
jgi:hypothetical protein